MHRRILGAEDIHILHNQLQVLFLRWVSHIIFKGAHNPLINRAPARLFLLMKDSKKQFSLCKNHVYCKYSLINISEYYIVVHARLSCKVRLWYIGHRWVVALVVATPTRTTWAGYPLHLPVPGWWEYIYFCVGTVSQIYHQSNYVIKLCLTLNPSLKPSIHI